MVIFESIKSKLEKDENYTIKFESGVIRIHGNIFELVIMPKALIDPNNLNHIVGKIDEMGKLIKSTPIYRKEKIKNFLEDGNN